MAQGEWTNFAIIGRTSDQEIDDRLEVEWALSAKPELEWVESFRVADLPKRDGLALRAP
jgi:hypothetical protein